MLVVELKNGKSYSFKDGEYSGYRYDGHAVVIFSADKQDSCIALFSIDAIVSVLHESVETQLEESECDE